MTTGLRPPFRPPRVGRVKPGARAFADKVALELGERAEKVKDERAAGRGSVDALGGESAHGLDQVRHRAGEAIQMGYSVKGLTPQ